jgi:hypothetical protein
MRKVLLAATLVPLGLAFAAVPASAETTVIKKHHGLMGSKKVVIKKHGDGATVKKVIKHDD